MTKAPGYLVRVRPGRLDLEQFRSLVATLARPRTSARGRGCCAEPTPSSAAPLADVDAPFVASEAAALEELRLAAVEGRIDTDLERGRHAELVPELSALVRAHPLRERLHGQLILALYRCGRQADALDAYRAAKRMLDEELGLEPSPALRELEHAILTHDASLAANGSAVDERTAVALPVEPSHSPPRWGRIALVATGVILLVAASAMAAVLATDTDSASKARPSAGPIAAVVVRPRHKARTRADAQPVKHVVHHAAVAPGDRADRDRGGDPVAKATTPMVPPATKKLAPPGKTLTDDFGGGARRRCGTPGRRYGATGALQNGSRLHDSRTPRRVASTIGRPVWEPVSFRRQFRRARRLPAAWVAYR